MAGESKQIYQLTSGTFNGSSLVPFEVPNTDSSTSAERPYITRKTTGDEVSEFVAKTQEFETDLETDSKTIIGAINEVKGSLSAVAVSGSYTDLKNKPDQPEYIATKVSTPDSSGKVTLSFAELNCTARPSVVMAMPQSYRGVATYSFDDSASSVILYFNNMDGSAHTGATRYSIVVYQ